jgi:hypothetical protein
MSLQEIFYELSQLQQVIGDFCSVFPPGINSITSVLVNLPVILLWIITLPPRTFLCILSSLAEIPIYGLIANLFPPITILCPICTSSANVCYSNCPGCSNTNECITLPSSISSFCKKAQPYFSLLNEIFCLIGYVILVILQPVIEIINLIIAPTNKQLCLTPNPNNCFGGDPNE